MKISNDNLCKLSLLIVKIYRYLALGNVTKVTIIVTLVHTLSSRMSGFLRYFCYVNLRYFCNHNLL